MTQIHIEPFAGALGAEVSGIDLRAELSDDLIAEIRDALLTHHVVFFRDQSLDPSSQVDFGKRFGVLEDYPLVAPLPDHPKVIPVIKEPDDVSNFGGGWHTDLIYRPEPPLGTMLYAIEVPSRGGDTLFADGFLAYRALSPRMQAMLSTLSVEYNVRHVSRAVAHRSGSAESSNRPRAGNRSMPSRSDEDVLNTSPVHPLVRTHPESGEQCLYFSREHTINFEGMTPRESEPLLDWLQAHMTQPVFTTRFHWAPGSMAFWDNRCVSHYALNDYPGERRHMHRLTIAGDTPR
jgi:taurine dioxygenase